MLSRTYRPASNENKAHVKNMGMPTEIVLDTFINYLEKVLKIYNGTGVYECEAKTIYVLGLRFVKR